MTSTGSPAAASDEVDLDAATRDRGAPVADRDESGVNAVRSTSRPVARSSTAQNAWGIPPMRTLPAQSISSSP